MYLLCLGQELIVETLGAGPNCQKVQLFAVWSNLLGTETQRVLFCFFPRLRFGYPGAGDRGTVAVGDLTWSDDGNYICKKFEWWSPISSCHHYHHRMVAAQPSMVTRHLFLGQVTIYHNNISQEKSFVLPHHISNDDHRKLSATAHLSKSDNRGWKENSAGKWREREKPIGHDECWIIQSNETHFHRLMSKHVNNNMVPGHADAAGGEGGC